jgi:mono/diheme cytochrome c family protein
MRIRQCVISLGILATHFSFLSRGGLPLSALAPVHAQADSPPTSNRAIPAASELYQRHCAKCHGKDGSGSPGRHSLPDIPDFTAANWQEQRSDKELLASILEGKGDDMPAFARKIKEQQARDLVSHVRSFAPTKKGSKQDKKHEPDSSDFEERFSRLQKEMEKLRRQSRELSKMADTRPVAQLFQQECAKCHPRCVLPRAIEER